MPQTQGPSNLLFLHLACQLKYGTLTDPYIYLTVSSEEANHYVRRQHHEDSSYLPALLQLIRKSNMALLVSSPDPQMLQALLLSERPSRVQHGNKGGTISLRMIPKRTTLMMMMLTMSQVMGLTNHSLATWLIPWPG